MNLWICELWIMRRADKLMRYCCFHTSKLVSVVITLVWHCKWLWQHFEWYWEWKQCLQPFQCTLICIPAVLHLHSFQTGAKICLNTCFNINLDNSVNRVIKISNEKKYISQNDKKMKYFILKRPFNLEQNHSIWGKNGFYALHLIERKLRLWLNTNFHNLCKWFSLKLFGKISM